MENKGNTVAAVVVSFNRKNLLVNCIEAIVEQTKSVDEIFLIDNRSTDGTPEYLIKKGLIPDLKYHFCDAMGNCSVRSHISSSAGVKIKLTYLRKAVNDGGAGGFYSGMKLAYNSGYDWLWMMDDDGLPEINQLEVLLKTSQKNNIDFANALVLNKDIKTKLAFGLKSYKKIDDFKKDEELVWDDINPFNGTLIKRSLVKKIGFIKKEMFIWGDEMEYWLRTKKHKGRIATIVKAVHYHPKIRSNQTPLFPFINGLKIHIKTSRKEIFFRNMGFNSKEYYRTKIYFDCLKYSLFYLSRFDFKGWKTFYISYFQGVRNHFPVK